jgi:hypothetical protein
VSSMELMGFGGACDIICGLVEWIEPKVGWGGWIRVYVWVCERAGLEGNVLGSRTGLA